MKYDEVLEQEKELLLFIENYKKEAIHVEFTIEIRKKRCAKDSSYDTTSQPRKKNLPERSNPQSKSKRKTISPKKGKIVSVALCANLISNRVSRQVIAKSTQGLAKRTYKLTNFALASTCDSVWPRLNRLQKLWK